MGLKLIGLIFFIHLSTYAADKINFSSIGFGHDVKFEVQVDLPKGQKLNKGAPSSITIFERQGNRWSESKKIDLNNHFSISERITLIESVSFKNNNSELKVVASLYHCNRVTNNFCVIDSFEGLIKRNKSLSATNAKVELRGSNP